MICPPNRGSPKHLAETEAKCYQLALGALFPELSPQVNTNILDFSKVSITCLQQLCLVMKIWLWKDCEKRRKVLLYQLDPQYNKGREEGT